MAQKIVIAEIDVNIDALIKSTSTLKKEIDAIKQEQKELANAGDTSSKQFVKNAADLKVLGQAYNSNIKAISENTQAIADQTQRTELLNQVIGAEVTSIKEARAQNQLLNKLRNETNVTTDEGRQELEKLNAQLDRNNAFIKDNADAYLKQKINVGNYTESIKEAFSELNIFNGGLGGFIQRSQEAGGVGNLLGASLKGAATSFLGLAKASLAFIATPIGAVLALLVGAFALIKNAMDRSEDATNKLKISFSAITGVFNTVLKALEPLGEFLIDGIVMGFEKTLEVAEKARVALAEFLDFLGFEDGAKAVLDFNDAINEGTANARALATAEAELEKAQRQSRLTQLQYQKDAEKLRQQRDDESNSISERIALNDQLGLVLQQQLAEELRIAEQALIVANLRIEAEGQTKETLDEQSKALTEIADIQERITGQESEQLSNLNSLRREAAAQAKEIADKAIAEQESQIELFIQQQGVRARTLREQLDLDSEIAQKRIEVLKAELKNRNITQTEFDAELLAIQNELLQSRAELISDEAQRELDAYIQANQSKIDSDLFFSQQSLEVEQTRLNGIAEQRRLFAEQQLEAGVINQTEFNDAINQINEENRIALEEQQKQRDEAQNEKDLIDLENKRIADDELNENNFALEAERLERQRLLEVEAANKTGADLDAINKKYASFRTTLERQVQDARIQANQQSFNAIAGLLGQESQLGKLAAIAAIINSTVTESTKAFNTASVLAANPLTAPLAANATIQGGIIIATGAANVARTVVPKLEQGGIVGVGGKRHSQGGTKFYGDDGSMFEAEKGEGIGVLNRGAYASFLDFNNRFGSGGTTRAGFAEGGGIITRAIPSQNESQLEFLQAIQNLPTPVVTVEDIRAGNQSYVEVMEGGNV